MSATTVKRLAILIAILGLIIVGGFNWHRIRVEGMAESVLAAAEVAQKEGDFATAKDLYAQHIQVVSDNNIEVRLKYAETLLQSDRSPKSQKEALQIYDDILKRFQAREDVRKLRIKLKMDMAKFNSSAGHGDGADADLDILLHKDELDTKEEDGSLLFQRARCYEEDKDFKNAVAKFQEAIENNAPEKIEAYQRCAMLLCHQIDPPRRKEADQLIEEMVKADPDNDQVHLARGRYLLSVAAKEQSRRQSLLSEAKKDFQRARELAPADAEAYLELANVERALDKDGMGESGRDSARQVLEEGLQKAPTSAALYQAMANLELGIGADAHPLDKSIATLERGLKALAQKPNSAREQWSLRMLLAERLFSRGDTAKLLMQIEELKKLGYVPHYVRYFNACYHINNKEFSKALQVLIPLDALASAQALFRRDDDAWRRFQSDVKVLLAQCLRQLGDPERQRDTYLAAVTANPRNVAAQLGLIATLEIQGDLDGAISQCEELVAQKVPGERTRLAQLMIRRNQRRPQSQRDWSEVKQVIDLISAEAPKSVDPFVLRADVLSAQRDFAGAWKELEAARSTFLDNVQIWVYEVTLRQMEGRRDEAFKLLDQAQKQFGDGVELRIARAGLLSSSETGPPVAKALLELSEGSEHFSNDDRRRLLSVLAVHLEKEGDLDGAYRLCSQVAELDRNDMPMRRHLLDLASRLGKTEEIEQYIKQIKDLEGPDGLVGQLCTAQYLILQAGRGDDKNAQDALRRRARALLNVLGSRHRDSSDIPRALAWLEEQELTQHKDDLTPEEIRAREESIISSCLEAIKLGQRDETIVRRTMQLLFQHDRGREALELLNIPLERQLAANLGQWVEADAVNQRDYARAEEIARKAIAAHPGDFQERLGLVRILLASGDVDGAETESRKAVDLVPSDPARWLSLVNVLVKSGRAEKAAKAVDDVEARLPQLPEAQKPLTLAQCCSMLGDAFAAGGNDAAKQKWYADAERWYEKALAEKPENLQILSGLAAFLINSDQLDKAESRLEAIRKQGDAVKSANARALAKRLLAQLLAARSDPERLQEALSLFEPNNKLAPPGQEGKTLQDPEDLRTLSRVLAGDGTAPRRKRAIEILESLVNRNAAKADDRFRLARLYDASGNWPKARETYRELDLRTRNPRDLETLNLRPNFLDRFILSLLEHHRAGQEQDLTEAQKLVDELTQLRSDSLIPLFRQVEIYQAQNQLDKAAEVIGAKAKLPNLAPRARETLAQLAENLDRFELAEQLFRDNEKQLPPPEGTIHFALFLGRRNHVDKALDRCEPLWKDPNINIETIARACVEVLLNGHKNPDPTQLKRVCDHLEHAQEAHAKDPRAMIALLVALGSLREREPNYREAKRLYAEAIKQGAGTSAPRTRTEVAMALNNLAWLTVLQQGKRNAGDALKHLNEAIAISGPQSDLLDTRGMIYLIAGDNTRAVFDLQRAVATGPSPDKLFHLAQAYLKANNKAEAKKTLEAAKAKGLEPSVLHALEQESYQRVLKELEAL
jgi:predicted Zn-dependent protease